MTATLPTGQVQVSAFYSGLGFHWQDTYIFKNTVALPKGTRIDGELVYDNSAGNPNNPFSPPQEVSWGENSTNEMGSLLLNVMPHVQTDLTTLNAAIYAIHWRPRRPLAPSPSSSALAWWMPPARRRAR